MLTTGFKYFFGVCLAAVFAAVLFGYTSGGNHVGPVSLGYKGGVGDHVGYVVLMVGGVLAGFLAFLVVSFRDADATAQADLLKVDHVPAQRPVGSSLWPIAAAFSVAATVIGAVVHTWVFVAGLVLLTIIAFEWMIENWADRATGDPAANRELRSKIMSPIELPLLGLITVGAIVVLTSRILLAVSKTGAVVITSLIGVLVLLVAILFAVRPRLSRNVVSAIVALLAVALIGGGIVSAAVGERSFEHHGGEHGEEKHSEGK